MHNLSCKKYEYAENSGEEKHKRSKSQTINSIKYRKGNSMQENSMEDMSNFIKNSNSSYQESKNASRSRGKRDKIVSFPSRTVTKVINGVIRSKKINPVSVHALKKIAFKSFDKRRVGTNLDRREGSFDDPLSFLRSSSACHKYNQEKVSTGKK